MRHFTKLLVLTLTLVVHDQVQAQGLTSKKEIILELSAQSIDQLVKMNFGVAKGMHEYGYRYQFQQQQQNQPNGSFQGCLVSSTEEEFVYASQIEPTTFQGLSGFYVDVPSTKPISLQDVLESEKRTRLISLDQYSVFECTGYKWTPSYRWHDNTQKQQYSHPVVDEFSFKQCLAMGGMEERCRQSAKKYDSSKISQEEINCNNKEKNKTSEYKITSCQIVRGDQQRLQDLQQIKQIQHQQQQQQPQYSNPGY